MSYTLNIVSSKDYEKIKGKYPDKIQERLSNTLGFADTHTDTAYVKKTGDDVKDFGTSLHEIIELMSKVSPHDEEGIRAKDDDEPEMNIPSAPKYKTAEEIFSQAIEFAKKYSPLAYGARESALADLLKGTEYYKGFQPTSFEEALGSQYFQNIMPDIERSIKQNLSLSGMAESPALADLISKRRGELGTSIGEYLSNLGNERAGYSLQSRMGISPESAYNPYLETDVNQSNAQAQANYQEQLMRAQADYQKAMNEYQNKQSMTGVLSGFGGAAAGLALSPFTAGTSFAFSPMMGALGGGAIGSNIISPLFGGNQGPVSFQDALSIAKMYQPTTPFKASNSNINMQDALNNYQPWSSGGAGTATSVYGSTRIPRLSYN